MSQTSPVTGSAEVRDMLGSVPELWGSAGHVILPDAAFNAIARVFTKALDEARGHAQKPKEPIALIDRRLEDLAEANAIYGKDQRLNAPDKVARNDREISWLKDLRSILSLSDTSTVRGGAR